VVPWSDELSSSPSPLIAVFDLGRRPPFPVLRVWLRPRSGCWGWEKCVAASQFCQDVPRDLQLQPDQVTIKVVRSRIQIGVVVVWTTARSIRLPRRRDEGNNTRRARRIAGSGQRQQQQRVSLVGRLKVRDAPGLRFKQTDGPFRLELPTSGRQQPGPR